MIVREMVLICKSIQNVSVSGCTRKCVKASIQLLNKVGWMTSNLCSFKCSAAWMTFDITPEWFMKWLFYSNFGMWSVPPWTSCILVEYFIDNAASLRSALLISHRLNSNHLLTYDELTYFKMQLVRRIMGRSWMIL